MSDPTDAIKHKLANRMRIAIRWHKLTNEEQASQFVLDDPEIQAFIYDEAFEHERLHFIVSTLVDELYAADEAEVQSSASLGCAENTATN